MKYIFTLCFCLIIHLSFSQYIEKKWFDKSDSVFGYYINIVPSSQRVQGALILLDGYGGNADGFLSETKIHNVAWANDILTVCIPTGDRLYTDESMIGLLNKLLSEIKQTYKLKNDQFVIGGMSAGGTIALRYTELCKEKPGEYPVQPKAVFAVDSPVDLFDLYKSAERDLKKNNGGWWLAEGQMIIDRLKKELGDPYKDLSKFKSVSPFLIDAKDSANEKLLSGTAVRTYHDVDVNWHIQNRRRSLYETNMLDGSELISRLVAFGNKNAEFVSSKITGRRSNGQRHPHSWNIVDEIDLVSWIKEKLNFYPDHISPLYSYPSPDGWGRETIVLPFDFAKTISYKGFEELRFAPGWGDANSNEKWAYTILWWLDDAYNFDEKILQQNLEMYYSGLTKSTAIAGKLDMKLYTPSKVQVQKVKTDKGDKQTFTANATIFDAFVTKKPGVLYFKIHVKEYTDKNRTILFIESAGSSFNQKVWEQLDKINYDFKCDKGN